MKVALIGSYPPPYGGRSIHVQRLKKQLEENGIICIVYDGSGVPKKKKNVVVIKSISAWLIGQFLHTSDDIIHCHNYSLRLLALFSLLSILKDKRVVFTLHSFRYSLRRFNLWHKFVFWLSRKAGVHFIAVGPEIKKKVVSSGIIRTEYAEIIPSFISPTVREEEIKEIPQEIWDFIGNHTPIISANAYRISFYNNQDLYGIDMCIDLCANFKKNYPQIGFVFCLPDIGYRHYFNKMKQKVVEKDIKNNFLFMTKPCQFYPILMKSDVFVRPTNTDGYGISLAEAAYFRIPAVASDVCKRPEGTILFRSRDVDDFTLKVKDVIDNYQRYINRLDEISVDDNFEKILKMYKKLWR